MLRSWNFSLSMLATYVAVFLYWKHYPSREGFVLVGVAAATGLTLGLLRPRRRNYFANRADLCIHAYIIGDLFLEGVSFEIVRFFVPVDTGHELVSLIHHSNKFILCTLVLAGLVGGYHAYALNRAGVTTGNKRPKNIRTRC